MSPRRRVNWARPVWSFIGLLVAYYAFPVRLGESVALEVGSLVLTGAGLTLLGWMMVKELDHQRRGQASLSTETLAMLLVMLVMSFSLVFFLLNEVRPEQVAGLNTKTDALYFTLSTMTTVGFGDVHAEGQLARLLVCGLIVFNVVVVAALVRAQTSRRASLN